MKDEERNFEVPRHVSSEIGIGAGETPGSSGIISRFIRKEAQASPEDMEELRNWAERDIQSAIHKWNERAASLPFPEPCSIPSDLSELRRSNPDFDASLDRLCIAKHALTKFGESPSGKTPAAQNVGDTMHLVMIPWGLFTWELTDLGKNKNDVSDLFYKLAEFRGSQDEEVARSFSNMDLEIIRNLQAQTVNYLIGSNDDPEKITAVEYLVKKVSEDGEWGVALMQTTPHSGVVGPAPEENHEEGVAQDQTSGKHKIAGFAVNKMGVFEAMALTLQEKTLKIEKDFWLSANEMGVIPSDDENLNDNMQTMGPTIGRLFSGGDRRQIRLVVPG